MITKKEIFRNMFLQREERPVTSSRYVFKEGPSARVFNNLKISYCHKCFLHAQAVLDYLPKLKWSLVLAFGGTFSAYFFLKNFPFLLLYQLTKFYLRASSPEKVGMREIQNFEYTENEKGFFRGNSIFYIFI